MSCRLTWDGDPSMPVAWLTFGPGISQIRAAGGDVIPSFGGCTADHGWTDIADSCTSTRAVAKAYEKVITAYHVTRLDLDVEDNSLTRPAAIDRRNRAIHLVQRWAARHHRTAEFVYTLPTSTSGLGANGLRVLRSAKRHHARIKVVNIMTFDYYDGGHRRRSGEDLRDRLRQFRFEREGRHLPRVPLPSHGGRGAWGCFQSVNGQLAVPQLVAAQNPFPSATRADRNLLGLSVGQGRCS
jgi:hypothetical protein